METTPPWPGYYLDGKNPVRRPARLSPTDTGLRIEIEGGPAFWWPYAEIRQTQGFYDGEPVRLERGDVNPEIVVISDRNFLPALQRLAPEQRGRFHSPDRPRHRALQTSVAAAAALSILVGFYFWGIPAAAVHLAPYVPVSWESALGEAVLKTMGPEERRCENPGGQAAIDEMVAVLTAPLDSPYTYQVVFVDNPTVNAFALPGGKILIFRGLLGQTETPEQLAGVLAHEIQHIASRHTTRTLLQHASASLLLSALTGNGSSVTAYGLESARILGLFRYSRNNEEEADRKGMEIILASGTDPRGMIAFFETLKKNELEMLNPPKYLSTHPATEDRIETLKALAAPFPKRSSRLLSNRRWEELKNICGTEGDAIDDVMKSGSGSPPAGSFKR